MASSIVLKTLSIFLGLFFVFVGLMKLTPQINKEMHRAIRKTYVQHAKVFPLVQTLGFKISSKWYRKIVGGLEVACGFILLCIPGRLKQIANCILFTLTIGATYSYLVLGDKFEKVAPAIVFSLMLGCRLVVYVQVTRREQSLKNSPDTQPKDLKSE